MAEECVFCKIAAGEIPVKKIYENRNFFSIYDINPKTEGHCLIISKKHFINTLDLPEMLGSELLDCIKKTTLEILKKKETKAFNIVGNNFKEAGQIINHFHCHILPRKEGDGLKMVV
jgi:histidine triad (HIT) family protein